MHNRLKANLMRNANKGYMFHYMDSLNSNVYGDPLLKRSRKRMSPFTAAVLWLLLVIPVIYNVIGAFRK